jgi:Fe-S oxidoreductase/FAD/FMN-containing dehydrogenase
MKPLIRNTTPDAVIQPETEAELAELVRWAADKKIRLTPRGKATSGYGGVIPTKNGVVVDFYRMKNVVSIDSKALTATVQPGIVWEQLDRALGKQGLTLRLYPTSYPSSSVGGWLAQGGVGIGSYESGWFKDNVVSARVVAPDGNVKVFANDELDLISDAEGITGLISEVTIKIKPAEDMEILAIGCSTPDALQNLAESVVQEKLPIWSMIFTNPRMAELKNKAPLKEHLGHPAEERTLLPESYIVILAFSKSQAQAVTPKLTQLAGKYDAQILDEHIAQHEWDNRFKLMVVKRLGPSLVPSEVVIPLSSLSSFISEIENKVEQPIVKEGVVILDGAGGQPEVAVLGFIPCDQRRFSYNFIFGLVLSIMKIAKNLGGRPYSTGLYFTKKAKEVIGKERLDRIKKYKKQVDPGSILNPGKVIGSKLIGMALGIGGFFEPLIRRFGNRVTTEIGERPDKDIRGIPADIAWYAYSCSQCGYCVDGCTQFYGRGWESQSPRGKWYWLREYMEGREKWNQFMIDSIISCTTCERCNSRCSASLPVETSWLKLRGELINEGEHMTFPPFEMMAAALEKEGDIWAGYRRNRDEWFPEDIKEKHGPNHKAPYVYFAGCTASYVEHDIGMATARLLDEAGVDYSYLGKKENCCGTPMLVAGKWDLFAETMKKNIAAVKNSGADTVINSCPACDMMWRHVYPDWAKKLGIDYDIKSKHYSEVVADKLTSGEFAFKENGQKPVTVTWHDSCHLGRVSGVYEPPRDVIKAIPNVNFVEMDHNKEDAYCCGSVLSLLHDQEAAADIGEVKLNEAVDAGAEKILALCPCCEFQMRVTADTKNTPIEVVDLARFASSALGYEFPDPNPEVKRQWAVFEKMIALMTPEGFAELMQSMWPELVGAMPLKMGPMMKVMAKIPGVMWMMRPVFPILFPKLLPGMMPKVMPTMLNRVADRIPMPDYMAEQMPELMPKVMDNLMPHMIKDVVKIVKTPLINYLKGKKPVEAEVE